MPVELAVQSALTALSVTVMAVYLWWRLGPRRCPKCGRWVYGVWGLARRYLHCSRCGETFEGPARPH